MIESAINSVLLANGTLIYDTQELATTGVLFSFGVMGGAGSGCIIFSSFFYQQTPHGLIILSLCLGDLLACLNIFISTGANLIRGGLQTGQMGLQKCMIEGFVQMIAFSISTTCLSLIAAERYFAVFFGYRDHSKKVLIAITCCWVYAIGFASKTMTSGSYYQLLTGRVTCAPLCSNGDMMPLCLFGAAMTGASSILASVLYLKLFRFYKTSRSRQRNSSGDEREKTLLRKFAIIVLSFMVLSFPFLGCFLYEAFSGNRIPPSLGHFRDIVFSLNSTFNPYLLYYLDSTIKQQVDHVFLSRWLLPRSPSSHALESVSQFPAITKSPVFIASVASQTTYQKEIMEMTTLFVNDNNLP